MEFLKNLDMYCFCSMYSCIDDKTKIILSKVHKQICDYLIKSFVAKQQLENKYDYQKIEGFKSLIGYPIFKDEEIVTKKISKTYKG